MAKSKKLTVAGKEVTVSELTMQQIFDLSGGKYENPVSQISDLLSLTTGLKREDIMPWAPSEIGEMVDAVLEVNSDFLSQANKLEMGQTAEAMERLIRSIFTLSFLT